MMVDVTGESRYLVEVAALLGRVNKYLKFYDY